MGKSGYTSSSPFLPPSSPAPPCRQRQRNITIVVFKVLFNWKGKIERHNVTLNIKSVISPLPTNKIGYLHEITRSHSWSSHNFPWWCWMKWMLCDQNAGGGKKNLINSSKAHLRNRWFSDLEISLNIVIMWRPK